METLLKDLRYGFRSLIKHPGFTAIVIITLALGIGASTAIFSVVNSVVLRRLPYKDADRIVAIPELNADGRRAQVTAANFYDWRQQNTVFEHLAAIRTTSSNLTVGDQAERIDISQTTANFFSVFDLQPVYGRLFIPEDEQAGHAPIAVLSYELWQRRFGGDKDVVGKSITLDGKPYTIVGITPATFQDPFKAELWLPPLRLVPELNERMDVTQNRGMGYLFSVAKLRQGVTLRQAASEMETITARLRQQYPDTNNRRFNRVVSLQEDVIGDISRMLWLLFGAVSFVLLIACANVANLLLANSSSRVKEMSIRAALGASRWRVMRQLFTESTMLALTGGAAGFLLSFWLLSFIKKLLPIDFPRINEIHMDWRVLGFTLVASVITGILFGFAPALQFARADLQDAIRETGRGTSGSLRRNRFRQVLIVSEVALSVVLLAGAGLLFRSFMRLQSVNAGFMAEQVLTARLTPSGTNFKKDSERLRFYREVIDKMSSVSGVRDVGAINTLPLSKGPTAGFRIEDRPITTPDKWPMANYRSVTPNYFRAMGIPIVQGRAFTDRDVYNAPLAMIVNQALADQDFPGESAIGKRINFGNTDSNNQPVWFEIVGVTANVRSLELREEPTAELYFSSEQDPWDEMSLVVRSTGDPDSVAGALRQVVTDVDRTVPISDVQTMKQIVSTSVTQPRFNLFLVALFSVIALLLSAAGIYGVTSYSVSQRTHELGIRMALGAQVRDVLGMILKQGMGVIAIGLVLGLGAAFVLLRLMKSLLFGVTETDPLTFVVTTVVLTFVALIACYVPARRATKVDPLEALRYE
jgi:putative ABC transport system permease protein